MAHERSISNRGTDESDPAGLVTAATLPAELEQHLQIDTQARQPAPKHCQRESDLWRQHFEKITPSGKPNEPADRSPLLKLDPLSSESTEQDLNKRLHVVNEFLQQKDLTPRQERLHKLLRECLEAALDSSSTDVLVRLQQAEETCRQHEWYYREGRSKLDNLEREILHYKKLEIYARCGDYMAYALRDITTIKEGGNLWSNTADMLEQEEEEAEMEAQRLGASKKTYWMQKRTHKSLYTVCNRAGLKAQEVKETFKWYKHWIISYSDRNKLMHAGFEDLARRGLWPILGDRIQSDLDALPNLFHHSEEEEMEHMKKLLTDIRDMWVWLPRSDGGWQPRNPVHEAYTKLQIGDFDLIRQAAAIPDEDPEWQTKVVELKQQDDLRKRQSERATQQREAAEKREAKIEEGRRKKLEGLGGLLRDEKAKSRELEIQIEALRKENEALRLGETTNK